MPDTSEFAVPALIWPAIGRVVKVTESSYQRPPIDPQKLLAHLDDWKRGEELPGRTLSYLKTGRLPELLDDPDNDTAAELWAIWEPWEKGKATPADVVAELEAAGLAAFIESTKAT